MILLIVQIVVSLLLIGAVLLQSQGSGLSTSFGGTGEFYRSRRSLEKFIVWATVVIAGLFAVVSIILLFPHK